jgi:hypothetical protein
MIIHSSLTPAATKLASFGRFFSCSMPEHPKIIQNLD